MNASRVLFHFSFIRLPEKMSVVINFYQLSLLIINVINGRVKILILSGFICNFLLIITFLCISLHEEW